MVARHCVVLWWGSSTRNAVDASLKRTIEAAPPVLATARALVPTVVAKRLERDRPHPYELAWHMRGFVAGAVVFRPDFFGGGDLDGMGVVQGGESSYEVVLRCQFGTVVPKAIAIHASLGVLTDLLVRSPAFADVEQVCGGQ